MAVNYPGVDEVLVERFDDSRPHAGKRFACIQAHSDDIPLSCGGLLAKLVAEGYRGWLIQTTNDMMCGPTSSAGETILQNEREVEALAAALGLETPVINFGYRNHFLDEASPLELRARLVYIFRALQIDTVITFNPWGHGEENPDHYVTGQAVEAAKWMAGGDKDYPEHALAGVQPYVVSDQWYFVGRPGQPFNRVVDITPFIDLKVETMALNKAQGPAGSQGSQLKQQLASLGLELPMLGGDDDTADREYIREFGLESYKAMGAKWGCEYAERFFYIGAGGSFARDHSNDKLLTMVREQATTLRAADGGGSGSSSSREAAIAAFVKQRSAQSIYGE
jgi:LmbE family N-acetylglucosaminyl deacetylase